MIRSNDEDGKMSDDIQKSSDEDVKGDGSSDGVGKNAFNGQHSFSETEAGSYYLGPVVKKCLKNPYTQCLARKKGTDEYYMMKMLVLNGTKEEYCLHRRAVIHTEYSILSLLKGHSGVIQLHDFFKETIIGPDKKEQKRICMVLECLIPHGCHNTELIPLSDYLKEKKRLSEIEALHIFLNILLVIEDLHKMNIVHKNLKLSCIFLNRRTLKVKLSNFYYAKLLCADNDVVYKQRPAHRSYSSSPDLILGRTVSAKLCDMWAAGVVLYTMLHGKVPFIGNATLESAIADTPALANLYSKIIANDYASSDYIGLSDGTKRLIKALLCKEPNGPLKASQAVRMVYSVLAFQSSQKNLFRSHLSDQVVPECPTTVSRPEYVMLMNATPAAASEVFKIAILSELPLKTTKLNRQKIKGRKNQRQ